MAQKRSKVVLVVSVMLMLFFMPFRIIATDIYCVPQEVRLPYPGMLSNNPLFIIKKIRDKILEQFIIRSDKQLEYYLFQSNKYLAEMLLQMQAKNDAYVIKTGLRSGNYLTLFVSLYGQLAQNNPSILNKLACDFYYIIEFQIMKYNEIIANMQYGEQKKQLIQIVEQLKQNKEGFDNLLTTMNNKIIIYE